MSQSTNSKPYDLEERTFQFAKRCRDFIQQSPKNPANYEYGKQLLRSSGSVASNYIEANEAISKKDFSHRIKISRKEAKESRLWLRLWDTGSDERLQAEQQELMQEAVELGKIFGKIVEKSK